MVKKNVRDFYNKTAQQWADRFYADDEHSSVLVEFMKDLHRGARVLDLCCGAGYDARRLAEMGASVVGIDLSEESIAIARDRNPSIPFYVGNMLEDYSHIGKVDAIICLAGLVHLPVEQLRTAFECMAEVMNVGGEILFMIRDGEGRVDRMSDVVVDGEEYDRSFYAHNLGELQKHSKGLFVFDRVIGDPNESIWVNYVFKKVHDKISIIPMVTDEDMEGKGYVHWKSWHETYTGLVDPTYMERLTLEKCVEIAHRWPDNILVVKDGEKVIGFVGYGVHQDDALGDCGEVFAIYVLAEYHGQRVGYALMNAAFEKLAAYPRIAVWVLAGNQKAIRFYERYGFCLDGTKKEIKLGTPNQELRMVYDRRIHGELDKLGIPYTSHIILQDKDGITVARIVSGADSYILKAFQKEKHRREIANYRLLASLGIPTIRVLASTESALLLEDLDSHPTYRLGTEEDMSDPQVAKCLAVWYRQLHDQGYDHVCQYGDGMYDEADFFTWENVAHIKEQTATQDAPAWALLEQDFAAIHDRLAHIRRTLTYNDFYYTNMVVAKDKSAAFMFDYNLLGKGYAYSDLNNVTFSLSEEAGKALLEEYGEFDSTEKALHDVVSVVVSLYMACQREEFPWWAQEMLEELDTTFIDKIATLREYL